MRKPRRSDPRSWTASYGQLKVFLPIWLYMALLRLPIPMFLTLCDLLNPTDVQWPSPGTPGSTASGATSALLSPPGGSNRSPSLGLPPSPFSLVQPETLYKSPSRPPTAVGQRGFTSGTPIGANTPLSPLHGMQHMAGSLGEAGWEKPPSPTSPPGIQEPSTPTTPEHMSQLDLAGQLCGVHLLGVHRLSSLLGQLKDTLVPSGVRWRVELCIYFGGRLIAPLAVTPYAEASAAPEWDVELSTGALTSALPREAVLSCTLAMQRSKKDEPKPIGWANLPLFDYNGFLVSGAVSLALWPCLEGDSRGGRGHPLGPHAPNRADSEVCDERR